MSPTSSPPSGHWSLAPSVVLQRLGDAAVAVNLASDRVLELNETAARLLELLDAGTPAADVAGILASEYDVAADVVAADVADTLALLEAEGIVRRSDG